MSMLLDERGKAIAGAFLPHQWDKGAPANYPRMLVCGIWAVLLLVLLIRAYVAPQRNSVYPIFANAAREWRDGVDIYDKSLPRGGMDKFRYLPIIAMAFTPFASFPDAIGGVLWRLCNTAAYLTGVIAFFWVVFPRQPTLPCNAVTPLAWLLLPLSIGSLNNAQPNALAVGCLMLGAALAMKERWNLAAFCLAVPVLIKIYPVGVVGLYLLVQPRIGWRVGLMVAAGFLIPFAMREPDVVAQSYQSWVQQVANDNRHDRTVENSYRDFHVLTRFAGVPLEEQTYQVLQLAMAGLAGLLVLRGHWLGWSREHHYRAAFDLGCCWIILFGPATENATYAFLAPTMALAVWEAWQNGQPVWKRMWAVATVGVFILAALVSALAMGKFVSYFLMPLGGLLVFVERVLSYLGPERELVQLAEPEPLPLNQPA